MDDNVKDGQSDEDEGLSPEDPSGQQVAIRAIGGDDLEARYINLATINFDRAAFYLTVSQFPPPTITSPDDARRIAEQGYVPAQVVGKFVLTPLMVEELLSILQTQLDSYRQSHPSSEPRIDPEEDHATR